MMRFPRAALIAALLAAGSHAQTAPNGEAYVGEPFFDDFTGSSVNTAVWQIATWAEHGGQTGTERCFTRDGVLHLHFINDAQRGYLSSAIQTRKEFLFGKWEARVKPSSTPGVLNSFYTIDWDNTAQTSSADDGTKQEIDIEFLTKSFGVAKGEVHFALHESGKTSWDTRPDVKLWFNPSDGFHRVGFDITPEYIEWFVDDSIVGRYRYGGGNPIAITAPYALKLNAWSAVDWIGGPPAAGTVCDYQIDWIRFTPRATRVEEQSPPRVAPAIRTTAQLLFPGSFRESPGLNHSYDANGRALSARGPEVLRAFPARSVVLRNP